MPHPGGAAHEMGYFNPNPPREWKTKWGRVPLFALYPGGVSVPGKPSEYLHPWKLAQLYAVELEDCIVVREEELDQPFNKGLRELVAKLPALRPRADGNYSVPLGAEAVMTTEPHDEHDDSEDGRCPDCGEFADICECHIGDDCGRWRNGRLTGSCSKAGSEECDFECPHRSSLYRTRAVGGNDGR